MENKELTTLDELTKFCKKNEHFFVYTAQDDTEECRIIFSGPASSIPEILLNKNLMPISADGALFEVSFEYRVETEEYVLGISVLV